MASVKKKFLYLKEAYEIRKKYESSLYKGLLSFILNSFSYALGTKMLKGPLYVGYDVTFRCNFSCRYCDRWKIRKPGELTTEESKKNNSRFRKVWSLAFFF